MYQNIPIIDRPLASEVFAITAERRAAIQDEINAFEHYPKPSLRQVGGGGSIASVGHGRLGQASPSAMGHHEYAHVGRPLHIEPRNMCRAPKEIDSLESRQPRLRFEEKPSHRQKISGSELSIRESGFGASSSSISESNYDINLQTLFGGKSVIDGPLLLNDLYEGGRVVDRSIFYVTLPAQIDHVRSIAPLESYLPSRKTRTGILPAIPRNVDFDFPISAVLEEHIRK